MIYRDEDFIQLSALQHYCFCPRQCALSYIEQVWEENLLTAEGGVMHDRAHEEEFEARDGVRIERGMPLRSKKLGLIGKADVVEFRRASDRKTWLPFPVEYKHGRPKENNCDKVQLCAQAICLEEMMRATVSCGAIFYGKTRHRLDVSFDERLRSETEEAIRQVRAFLAEGKTPSPRYTKKCEACSLINRCLPKAFGKKDAVAEYIKENMDLA